MGDHVQRHLRGDGRLREGPEREEQRRGVTVYDRDFMWLDRSIALVGDISLPTTGGGMEIDYKVRTGDPVLLVHREDMRASQYAVQWTRSIYPPSNLHLHSYADEHQLEQIVRHFAEGVVRERPSLPGAYLVVEGGEGCGKSTHRELLGNYLRTKGLEVVETREPGGTERGEITRDLLLNPKKFYQPLEPEAELLYFEAARAHLFDGVIKPALARGAVVLSDRNFYSTVAYQGYGRMLGLQSIDVFNHLAMRGVKPDLGFIIDIDPRAGLQNIRTAEFGNVDRFEQERPEFHQRLREGYLAVAKREPNVHVIPYSHNGAESMQADIRRHVDGLLQQFY